jgi:tetraacyldisaccharide 4'-kinase
VAVGGATLGGSGKTPLAIACALALAASGARVALVGHAYRARARRARVVRPEDAVVEVGDEALLAAREHAGDDGGARVVVAPSRAEAVDHVAGWADVLVFDGVAQMSPRRASLALLAVDANEPWGAAEARPPRGDLLAPRRRLVAACDAVVPVGHVDGASGGAVLGVDAAHSVWPAAASSRGAWMGTYASHSRAPGPTLLTWADLRGLRLGFLSALARPNRVVRDLSAHGVSPVSCVRAPDHGPIDAALVRACRNASRHAKIDLWLLTPKCATHVERSTAGPADTLGAPLATLEHSLVLPPSLCARLRGLAAS